MADDAGNAFTRSGMPIFVLHEDGFAEIHADLVVAADAKVAVGSAGLFHDGGVHGVEDRTQLRIGVW